MLPRTPIWHSGIRYYSEGMIGALAGVLATRPGNLRATDPLFFQEVLEAWNFMDPNVIEGGVAYRQENADKLREQFEFFTDHIEDPEKRRRLRILFESFLVGEGEEAETEPQNNAGLPPKT